MPRSEKVFSIFLASPGDVSEERALLVDVISNWNRAWSRNLGLRLELLRWEDDAYPDIGEDAQDVINRQIPTEWDIFIGIMWSRFGTPTNRAGSGTQEEFDRALSRHASAPGEISLLFYFKDAPIAPSKMNLEQLSKVQQFKESVRSSGLLTWEFTDADQFEKLVSLHITRHIQEAQNSSHLQLDSPLSAEATGPHIADAINKLPASESCDSEEPDDSGYLDLVDQFSAQSAAMVDIANRLTVAQQELSDHSIRGRQELDEINANPATASSKKIRVAIAKVADEMLNFAQRVEQEIPLFRTAVDGSMTALTKLATLSIELYPEQLDSTKAAATTLLQTLIAARRSTEGFRDTTAALPRMTKELNFAKRKQVSALSSLVAELENGERLLAEGLIVLNIGQSR